MKSSEILTKARRLLKKTGHTKGTMARNKYRHQVDPTSPSAVKFCAYGLVYNVLGLKRHSLLDDEASKAVGKVLDYLHNTVPVGIQQTWSSVIRYNDDRATTPNDVDQWLFKAIQLAQIEGD